MSESSQNGAFKKTFKIVKGVKLDKIYPDGIKDEALTYYQALIIDTDSKKVIGEFPICGFYFESNKLKLVVPFNESGSVSTKTKDFDCTVCPAGLHLDTQTHYYGFFISNTFSINTAITSEVLGLKDFNFVQNYKANEGFSFFRIVKSDQVIGRSPTVHLAKLGDIGSKPDYPLASKYCVFDAVGNLSVYDLDKKEGKVPNHYIAVEKIGSDYACYFSDKNGAQQSLFSTRFTLDDMNVDRTLLKQMEIEYQTDLINKKLMSGGEIEQTFNRHEIRLSTLESNCVPERVASELVTNHATELGNAVLGVKVDGYGTDRDKSKLLVELATNSDLQQKVTEALRTDPGNLQGPPGERGTSGRASATAMQVAETLVGPKLTKLGKAVLEATDRRGKNYLSTLQKI